MRFSASTDNINMIETFRSSCLVMSHLSEHLVFKISQDSIEFIADPTYHNFVCEARSKINRAYFRDYQFSGLNSTHNLIYFKIHNGSLISCFSKIKQKESFKKMRIRLENIKDGFGLRITYQFPDSSGSRNYSDTVHVRIIKHDQWSEFDESSIENAHVSFFMPTFKEMMKTVRQLAKTSKTCDFVVKFDESYATFKTESESSQKTYTSELSWEHLDICKLTLTRVNLYEDRYKWFRTKVNTKIIHLLFKTFIPFKPAQVTCTILKDGAIIFHFYRDIGFLKVCISSFNED